MCGRINGNTSGELIWNIKYHDTWQFSGELSPTQDYPIIRKKPGTDELEALLARWGLIPEHCQGEEDLKKYKSTFNARSETVHQKPTFRKAFQRQRAIVQIDSFFEWSKLDGPRQPVVQKHPVRRPLYWTKPIKNLSQRTLVNHSGFLIGNLLRRFGT